MRYLHLLFIVLNQFYETHALILNVLYMTAQSVSQK